MSKIISDQSFKYHKKRLEKFWEKKWKINRTCDWWLSCMDMTGHMAATQSKQLMKEFCRRAALDGKITMEEASSLWTMLNSKDKTDWLIALNCLGHHYPRAFARENPKFTLL